MGFGVRGLNEVRAVVADVSSRPTITLDTIAAPSTNPHLSEVRVARPGHRPTHAMKTARPYPGDLHDVWCGLRGCAV